MQRLTANKAQCPQATYYLLQTHITMDKNILRQEMIQRKRQFTAYSLRELSLAIIVRLLAHPRIQAAQTIMLYHSLPDEVYTHDAIEQLFAAGKQVLLPAVINETHLELRPYEGENDLQLGSMNIFEPAGAPFNNYEQIEVVVVPGVSFDAKGNRLGRGRGYYDRFLLQVPQAYKLGICFDFQKVARVPTDSSDVPMHEVI